MSSSATLFDPRTAPVLGTDAALPCVPDERLTVPALRAHFAALGPFQPPATAALIPAAVLVALVLRPQGLTVLLTERAQHLPTHAGQIAFAGGKVDAADAHVQATALREAHEEIGLPPARVEVLGQLPGCASGAGFHISPVVGLVAAPPQWRPNAGEVADVFEVPLRFVMNPAHHRHHAHLHQGLRKQWVSMPYTAPGLPATPERFIWGATAAILRSFYQSMWAQGPTP